MSDITLDPIGSGYNLSKFNTNFTAISDKINTEILHLTGGNNIMQQSLDMNSNRILNLPLPSSNNEPLIKAQLLELASNDIGNATNIVYVDPEAVIHQLDDFLDATENRLGVVENSFLGKEVISVCKSVTEMTGASITLVNGKTITSAEAASIANTGAIIETVWNNTTSKAGGARYQLKTLAQHRTDIGDVVWVPDGNADHYLFGGPTYVATLVFRKTLPCEVFGVIPGEADSGTKLQSALDFMERNGGGEVIGSSLLYIGPGKFVNIKKNVTLRGVGGGFQLKQMKQTAVATVFVYLKDYAKIIDVKLSGSDYIFQRNTPDYDAYNKVGISTQGAVDKIGMRVKGVGFEKMGFSLVYIFDGTTDVVIDDCYTFGTQVGSYADFNPTTNEVTNWNANVNDVDHATKLTNGERAYTITNFHNSGAGASQITIRNNTVYNINDSFAAPNTGATDHKIYGNTHIKNTDGYYGGYGIDFNGCSKCKAWGNTIIGSSIGAHFHDGAFNNEEFGNYFEAAIGVRNDNAFKNKSTSSTIVVKTFGSSGKRAIGPGAGVIGSNTSTRFRVSNHDIRSATSSTTITNKTITNAVASSSSRVNLTITAHGLKGRMIGYVTGVVGTTEANGVWQLIYVDDNTVQLEGCTFVNAYVSGGNLAVSATSGVGICAPGNGTNSIVTAACTVEDMGYGVMSSGSSIIRDMDTEFSNVGVVQIGTGTNINQIRNARGLSSSATATNNLGGTATLASGTTTTVVTFAIAESDSSYKVLLANSQENLGIFWTNKTTTGFTINHTSPPANRQCDWFIFR